MSLNKSIIKDAALEWFHLRQGEGGQFGELGHLARRGPHLAPGEPAAGPDLLDEVAVVRRLHEAAHRRHSAIYSRILATLRDMLQPKLLNEELSVAISDVESF